MGLRGVGVSRSHHCGSQASLSKHLDIAEEDRSPGLRAPGGSLGEIRISRLQELETSLRLVPALFLILSLTGFVYLLFAKILFLDRIGCL